jgi:ribosomal protein S27E
MTMNDEIRVPVSLPLDSDGFLRRECPTCEEEFKWFSHAEGDHDAEQASQYFCPICGAAAGLDSWWTPAQLEYGFGSASGAIDEAMNDAIADAFKGIKGLKFKQNSSFSLDIETPDPLIEPDDMVIVEPPCHTNEPLKVPEGSTERVFCLVCGAQFAA